jgi:hypothetical protein
LVLGHAAELSFFDRTLERSPNSVCSRLMPPLNQTLWMLLVALTLPRRDGLKTKRLPGAAGLREARLRPQYAKLAPVCRDDKGAFVLQSACFGLGHRLLTIRSGFLYRAFTVRGPLNKCLRTPTPLCHVALPTCRTSTLALLASAIIPADPRPRGKATTNLVCPDLAYVDSRSGRPSATGPIPPDGFQLESHIPSPIRPRAHQRHAYRLRSTR